jgi:calmodulin
MEEELHQAFALFDRNGDGVVTKSELSEIFEKLGGQIKPAESLALLKTVDKDKSGSIDYKVRTIFG